MSFHIHYRVGAMKKLPISMPYLSVLLVNWVELKIVVKIIWLTTLYMLGLIVLFSDLHESELIGPDREPWTPTGHQLY